MARAHLVEPGKIVGIYYTMKDEHGNVLDTTRKGGKPLAFLCGAGNVLPGLEKALRGKERNAFVDVTVEPAEAYGVVREDLIEVVPRATFSPELKLVQGARIHGRDRAGKPMSATIRALDDETVTLDRNHPMAGRALHFEVTVAGIRDPSSDERARRRPSDPGHTMRGR